MATEFNPPYFHQGLFDVETRKIIEAPNRATLASIFTRRAEEQEKQEWLAKIKRMHDSGIHMPGSCPYCPLNYYYD